MGWDFELEIAPGAQPGVYAVVVVSPAGEAKGTVWLDAPGLLSRRRELAASVLASAAKTRAVLPTLERPVREVGQALFESVFTNEVHVLYTASVQQAAQQGEPLRVVLRLRAPELAGLPWETLFDPDASEYLCRQGPVVRYVETAQPAAPLPVDPPLRILALVAAPRDLPALDVAEERRRLTDAVDELASQRKVELVWAPEGSWPVLQQQLLAGPWHALHFVGHGGTDPAGGGGALALEDEATRQAAWVSATRFARLLHTSRPVPRLVVLNSCSSGEAAVDDLLSSSAAALVHSGVSAAVAMQFAVTDLAALAFTRGFYTALAAGREVDEAVQTGRIAIDGTGEHTLEWVTPVLYLRADTRLFTLTSVSGSPGDAPAISPGKIAYLAGYAADTAFGEDELDIAEDVESLCSVLIAEQVHPPLAVGLFGDWGTGKSFFMQKMRERIDWLARQSAMARNEGRSSDYCENVRQVTFNAWHYVDANLWASLITRIFDGLVGDDLDQNDLLTEEDRRRRGQRRQVLLAKLETVEVLAADARRRRDVAIDRLRVKQVERDQKHDTIASLRELRTADLRATVQEHPKVAEMAADAAATAVEKITNKRPEPADALALAREAHGTWNAVRRIWCGLQPRARVQLVVLAVMAASAAVILATMGRGAVARILSALVVVLPAIVITIRWLPTIRQARIVANAAARAVDHAVQRQYDRLDAELTALRAQIDDAQRQVDEAEQKIREVSEGRRLRDFIESRATSDDYRRGLGLIALIRRDLARLSALMAVRDPMAGDEPERIDRIILYIDDLDRCPAQRVVEVLEAVHLLLAFPLFVVVVGVDARWLLQSLKLRYTDIIMLDSVNSKADPEDALHWAATPQNYLDKIFQIPFSLRPMDERGFARLVRRAVGALSPEIVGALPPEAEEGAASTPRVRVDEGAVAGAAASSSGGLAPEVRTDTEAPLSLPRPIALDAATAATEVSRSTVPGTSTMLAFAADGRRLAAVYTADDPVVALLNPRTGLTTVIRSLGDKTATAALAPDGSLIVISMPDTLQVQDLLSGSVVDASRASLTLPAFSMDGRWITGVEGGRVVAREPRMKHERRSEGTIPDGTETCCVLPGAQAAVVAGTFGVRLVPFTAIDRVVPLTDDQVRTLAYSVNGQVLAAAAGESVRMWDTVSGRLLDWLSVGRTVTAISLAPAGSMLAVALGTDIIVIDRGTGTPLTRAYYDGESAVEHMAFSYDGHRLAAVGRHGEIRVWACVPRTGNLTSENLRLSDAEVEFLERLLPLVPTPRGAKRLVNVYRILRAPLRGEDIERLVGVNGRQPEHPAVLLLLAIVTGFPEQANEIIEGLLDRPAPTWREFLETFQQKRVDEPRTPEEAIWARFFERLDDIKAEGIPNDIRTYVEWAPRVARYSFRTGRLAKQRGAIEQ